MEHFNSSQLSPSRVGIDRWIFQSLLLYKKPDIILDEDAAQDIIDDALEPYDLDDGALAVYKYPREKLQALIEIVDFVWELCGEDPINVRRLLLKDMARSNGPTICG